jgi:hypothetical protein
VALGTLTGTFLEAGVSKNGRYYSSDQVKRSTAVLKQRVESGRPVGMMTTHHTDDLLHQGATVREVWLDDQGKGKYRAEVPDTDAGRNIWTMTRPDESGQRHVDAVSIYGGWLGEVRQIEVDGRMAEQGDDLLITRIDMVGDPGVEGARMDPESAEVVRVATESAGAAFTPVSEAAPAAAFDVFEAKPADTDTGDSDDEEDEAEAADPAKPYGDVTYADPGYQSDKKKRYPLNTKAHVKAAWSYINKQANQKPYTSTQLTSIKNKIKKSAKGFGLDLSEAAPVIPDTQVATVAENLIDAIAAWEAMVSVDAYQGPADVRVSAWVDNADVAAATGVVGNAAAAALKTLDPDQDGDLDLPGGDGSEPAGAVDVHCASCSGLVPDDAKFCPTCGEPLGESAAHNARPVTEAGEPDDPPEGGTDPSGSEEDPVSLSDEDRKAIVTDLADVLRAAITPAAPAAAEPAPAEAAPTQQAPANEAAPAPVSEGKSVADQVAEAVATAREEMKAEFATATATVLKEALTAQQDELREQMVAQGVGRKGRSIIETVTAIKPSDVPIHEMPAHEQNNARMSGLADQLTMAQYPDWLVDAVRPQAASA